MASGLVKPEAFIVLRERPLRATMRSSAELLALWTRAWACSLASTPAGINFVARAAEDRNRQILTLSAAPIAGAGSSRFPESSAGEAPPANGSDHDQSVSGIFAPRLPAAYERGWPRCCRAPPRFALGQKAKVKVGVLLPYSGTYAALGHNITDAMKLALAAAGNKLGGRDIELVQVDSEADPAKAPANTNKLVVGEKVDFLTGTGAFRRRDGDGQDRARGRNDHRRIQCRGANAVTREMCAAQCLPHLVQ